MSAGCAGFFFTTAMEFLAAISSVVSGLHP